MSPFAKTISIKNKKAYFQYFLLEEYEAGIVLGGTEIKSIREGKASFVDAFCAFHNGELYVKNLHISEYRLGTHYNHDPKRDRKLLLSRRELKKLETKTKERGFTIIPVLLYINEKGLAKLKIALAKGKHSYDKRETIKKKDVERDLDRRTDGFTRRL
ncbi:MAG: SsrA-binding protein SmpB [Bacteroidales bacterium]|nr:SsrA-binding protein SmpB [Bacteroidales bacterium]